MIRYSIFFLLVSTTFVCSQNINSIFPNFDKSGITRKQAIKKMGKYAALTAIGTFAILNPKKAQAQSMPQAPGGWD